MSMSRPSGKDGFIYGITFGAEIVGDAAAALPSGNDKFYIITAKAAAGSALPADLKVGHIFRVASAMTPIVGDNVKPVVFDKLTFAKDDDSSASLDVQENTTQVDTATSYSTDKFPSHSGSLSGVVQVGSQAQKDIVSRFHEQIEDDGAGNYIYTPIDDEPIWFCTSHYEAKESGEKSMWIFKPCVLTSLSMKKPMKGNQEFSCNYNIQGSLKPLIYEGVMP